MPSANMPEHGPNPLISVALCTFNGAGHLREQLDSLLSQTYQNLEIIAVDDCSSDATVAILREYAQGDPRLRVVVNTANIGFKRNFEFAILQCQGEFIAPCDQDDIWLPIKLSELRTVIGANAMAYCDSELIDADGHSLDKSMSDWWQMGDIRDPMTLVMDNCVSGHAMLFRRDLLLAALPVPDGLFYDWWLAAVAASRGGVVYCAKKLVRYRQHRSNVTNILRNRKSASDKPATGRGLRKVSDIETRLAGLASLPSAQQSSLIEFHRLWLRHATQWCSFRLALFIIAHRRQIFALSKRSTAKQLRKAAMFAFGVRAKRLVKKNKYSL
jgi:glycosyltransferase involved in cell wall biosynthesis